MAPKVGRGEDTDATRKAGISTIVCTASQEL